MQRPHPIIVTALALATVLSVAVHDARADDETRESAVWQLKTATFVHNNRMHNMLLRSLRQLRDPALQPLFSELVSKKHPELQIHGILGLGEIDPKQRINLALVADLKDTRHQAQVVSLAIESDLIDTEQLKQLLSWPELDIAVKIIVAGKLVALGELPNTKVVDDGIVNEEVFAIKAMSALLKAQLGDPEGLKVLNATAESDARERDTVRAMLLQTAMQHDFDKAGPWAMKIVAENPDSDGLMFLALRAAIEFKQPGAPERFIEHYRAAESVADRIRHVVLAMEIAKELGPKAFEIMAQDEVSIIQYMARTGKAVAEGADPTELMMKLIEQNHLVASKWVYMHAEDMPIEKAKAIYVALILAAEGEPNDPRFRGKRIENAVLATEAMADRMKDPAPIIKKLIQQVPAHTTEAMLMGLIRTERDDAHLLIEGVDTWPEQAKSAPALALLLRAKHGQKLTPQQIEELALMVRGGAGLRAPLRIQAAWVYGKVTGQHQVYLASVLGK